MSRKLWNVQTKWFDAHGKTDRWTSSHVPGETAREAVNTLLSGFEAEELDESHVEEIRVSPL